MSLRGQKRFFDRGLFVKGFGFLFHRGHGSFRGHLRGAACLMMVSVDRCLQMSFARSVCGFAAASTVSARSPIFRPGGTSSPPSCRTETLPLWRLPEDHVPCRVHPKVVPSHHMRCRMTASFRAVATAAFLKPLRAASRIAQAFSGENRFTRTIRLDAASTRRARMAVSPHLETRPEWSTSPDWCRLGVSPR